VDIAGSVDALEGEGPLLAEAATAAGVDAKVPTCPGWTVRDLLRHTGGVHRWAATTVRGASPDPVDSDLERVSGGWPPDGELVDWFRDGHGALVTTLRAAPADLECYTFLAAPSPLAMWSRRQLHETTIHRVDAESAAGWLTTPRADVAADGIDELLTCFITRPRSRFRLDPARSIAVVPTDAGPGDGTGWTVTVGPGAVVTERTADPGADLVVEGPAPALYLWLWNRAGPSDLVTSGDRSLLDAWREGVQVSWR
jgi:uncharacterized protein (TIGR03083 family)